MTAKHEIYIKNVVKKQQYQVLLLSSVISFPANKGCIDHTPNLLAKMISR